LPFGAAALPRPRAGFLAGLRAMNINPLFCAVCTSVTGRCWRPRGKNASVTPKRQQKMKVWLFPRFL